jgi:uncharacterized membrane protein
MGDVERPRERWIVMAIIIFGVVLTLGWVCCLGSGYALGQHKVSNRKCYFSVPKKSVRRFYLVPKRPND